MTTATPGVEAAAHARPSLPTPVATPDWVDPDSAPADGEALVRLRRKDTAGTADTADDGDLAGASADPDDDDPAGLPDDAPTGWRPGAGSVGALRPEDGAARWLVGAGAGAEKDWRSAGAAAVRAVAGLRRAPGAHPAHADDGAAVDDAGDGTAIPGAPGSGDGDAGRPDDAASAPAAARPDGADATTAADVPPGTDAGSTTNGGDGAGRSDPVPTVLVRPDRAADAPDDAEGWAALVTGIVLGSHRFSLRTGPKGATPVPRVRLAVPAEHREACAQAVVLARATALARDLADSPSGAKSPDWFASTAEVLVGDVPGLRTAVRDEDWLAREGFGGTLAVGGGSSRPPRLLELEWAPEGARGHVVLVGKGITFDTGGISIKPNAGMADMRTDCSGGAAVVGALRAIAERGDPVRVTGLVPLAENHVSGSSYRPGDVVRHRGGTTSEVTNTDAEGRMVLADALAYADETLDPDVVVDVATLTGAMKMALGVRTGGAFATTDELATRLVDAGARTGESWWRMPLTAHLDDDVTSTLADVRQAPSGPGGIMAALFLHRFTGGRPWVHLDIAGPARCDSPHEEVAKGATGFAARTLVEFCAAWS